MDTRQGRFLANRNQTSAAKQLETGHAWQARLEQFRLIDNIEHTIPYLEILHEFQEILIALRKPFLMISKIITSNNWGNIKHLWTLWKEEDTPAELLGLSCLGGNINLPTIQNCSMIYYCRIRTKQNTSEVNFWNIILLFRWHLLKKIRI